MQLLVIVLVVLGVVALLAVWRRLGGGGTRAEEHAIERHEHALGVLGDVSRRRADPPQSVRVVPSSESAKIHIKPTEEGAPLVPRPSGEEVPAPRVRLEPPVLPGLPLAFGTPVLGTPAVPPPVPPSPAWEPFDTEDDEEPQAAPPEISRPVRAPTRRPAGAGRRPGPDRTRPAGTGLARRRAVAATVVVLVAGGVAVAVTELGGSHNPPRSTGSTTTTTTHHRGGGGGGTGSTTTTSSTAPTTTTPSSIVPIDATATEVSYRAPATTYTLAFQVSGPCWIGIQQTAGGPWVWEETVESGQQATYSASGTVVVRLGAPPLVKVAVDGITVQLPSSNVQPYDLTFSPSS